MSTENTELWNVHMARGAISTPTVHATNAYTSSILPSFARSVRPTVHMCNKIILLRALVGSKVLTNLYGVLATGGGLYSINPRCTADGIVLFRGSNPNQGKLKEYLDPAPTRLFDDRLINFRPITHTVNELTSTAFETPTLNP
ncbi:hypothetical protein B0H13DRAFT_1858943 [Mycena leptocephala]|nr:hypothetical protein B0H13DRAFT_1858943 [Mycena leptocephala]